MKNYNIKKYVLAMLALTMIIILDSCQEESCEFDGVNSFNCEDYTDTENSGILIGTFLLGNGGGYFGDVGKIFNTQNVATEAIPGDSWNLYGTPPLVEYHPSNWTVADIGVVFGITTDVNDNIYLANSDIYYLHSYGPFTSNSTAYKPNGSSAIYKCSPPNYTATLYASLPSNMIAYNGIGNIAYDKWNDQLFATNLDDGKIYRIVNGTVTDSYDPFNPDTSGTASIAPQDERIFGIGVNIEGSDVKVYFPRVTTSGSRELYSITLSGTGGFPSPSSEVLEISGLPGSEQSITDIAFSSDNSKMILAERGGPHSAISFSYELVGGNWSTKVSRYYTGGSNGSNSAGGVDFFKFEECDQYFWNSGNYIKANNSTLVYGAEGIPFNGNTATGRLSTDYLVDFTAGNPKGGIGDVEVIDNHNCNCINNN